MAELDVEGLKRQIPKGIHVLQEASVVLTVPQADEIIAALEDRDRLRAAAQEAYDHLDGIIPVANALGDGAQHELYQAHGKLRVAVKSSDD